jgi:SAM-dependent methyltransferase
VPGSGGVATCLDKVLSRFILAVNDSKPTTLNQDQHWGRHAKAYDEVFLNSFGPGVENPLWQALDGVTEPKRKTVADLGCGTGALLNHLLARFGRVIALDFAPAMLKRAQERLGLEQSSSVTFLTRPMDELDDLTGQLDVALAINSLVMPDVRLIDRTLKAIRSSLRPAGVFMGIVPSIDAIQYQSMLLFDQALEHGLNIKDAQLFAAYHAEHRFYDFAFGQFKFQGLRQKFWQPFEVDHRLRKAGFHDIHTSKVLYPWDENNTGGTELSEHPPSWDWFFLAAP